FSYSFLIFFFQAEDGIRDGHVTGVQTCALPILKPLRYVLRYFVIAATLSVSYKLRLASLPAAIAGLCSFVAALFVEAFRQFYFRSEERRVGKECRSRWLWDLSKKNVS